MSEETTDSNPETKKAAPKKAPSKRASASSTSKAQAKKTTAAAKGTTRKAPAKKASASSKTTPGKKSAPKRKTAAASTRSSAPKVEQPTPQAASAEAADTLAGTEKAAGDNTTNDRASQSSSFSAEQLKQEFKEKDWAGYAIRGALMVLFGFLAWFATLANFVLAGVQFVILILTGRPNELIRRIIMVLGRYIVDVMQYLSFESDEPPFPLGKDFPEMD
ncbi:MAG: DUF4389 domain-containing protein [Alphaproteobacteria bacterium]|nr:DUF4389 domain-containing protein [Alphaproteobacteria bacterium]